MNKEKNDYNNINDSFLSNISELTKEVKEKKFELESFKNQIKSLKQEYQKQLSVYFSLNKNVIHIENNIENFYKEKSKIEKKNEIIILQFNDDVIKRLNDNSNKPNNKNVEDLILEFFEFKPDSSFEELVMINKNKDEWQILLKYSSKKGCSKNKINLLKSVIEKIVKDINYPYQIFVDFIKGIIRLNEIENELNDLNEKLMTENKNKNEIFLFLKNIENEIIRNEYLYKRMIKYTKQIYSMLEAFSKIKTKNENNSEEYEILNKNIREFQKIDFKKLIIPTDNLSSLSVRTNISDTESLYSLNTFQNSDLQKEFSSSLITLDNNNIKNNNTINKINTNSSIINNNNNQLRNSENFISKTNSIHSINNSIPPMKMKNFQKGIIINKSSCKPKKIKRKENDDENFSDDDIIENNNSIKLGQGSFVNINDDISHENIDNGINYALPMNLFKSLPSKLFEDQIEFQKKNKENTIFRNRNNKIIYQGIDDGSSNCNNVGGCCHFGAIFG